MVATVVGNILMSSTYGVAAFAQPAMGRLFQAEQQNAIDAILAVAWSGSREDARRSIKVGMAPEI